VHDVKCLERFSHLLTNHPLTSGLYIIEGGGFQVSGNASVTGTSVNLYNTGSKFPGIGGTFGAISLSGNGTLKLTPPTTGPYASVLLLQPVANPQVMTLSANAMAGITGTIDAPSAQLVESGNAHLNAAIVVDTLTLGGNSVANIVTLAAPTGTVAYTPAQIQAALGAGLRAPEASPTTTALGAGLRAPEGSPPDGAGQTNAIVGAYDDPSIYPGPNAFDSQTDFSSPQLELPAAIVSNQTSLTLLNGAGVISGSSSSLRSILATRQTGAVPDWVLDDLVADLVGSRGQEAHRAIGVPHRLFTRVTGARAGQDGVRLSGPSLAPIPAGPMSRPERPRQSGRPAARLADLLKVGGFCGLGAGLLAARNPRAGSVSSRRQFLKFKTTQVP